MNTYKVTATVTVSSTFTVEATDESAAHDNLVTDLQGANLFDWFPGAEPSRFHMLETTRVQSLSSPQQGTTSLEPYDGVPADTGSL